MEHPEVLIEYEQALRKKLKAGVRLDELDDIEEKSLEFGRLVRRSPERWTSTYKAWVEFSKTVPKGTKAEAREAFYRGYIS